MGLFGTILGKDIPESEGSDDKMEFKQDKKYRMCITDNTDKNDHQYRCNKTFVVPDCTLSLILEGLTHEEALELDLEIRNMLDRHDFRMR